MGRTGPVRPQSDYSAGTGEAAGAASSLLAWDPVAKRARWRVLHTDAIGGGMLTTAGNLVFQGTDTGKLVAYRADTGAKLWEMNVRPRDHGRAEHVFDRRHAIRRRARRHGRRDGALRPQPDEPVQGHGTCVHVRARRPRAGAARARSSTGRGRSRSRATPRRPRLHAAPISSANAARCATASQPRAAARSPTCATRRRPRSTRSNASCAAARTHKLGMPMFDWLTDADVAALRGYVLSRRAALLAAPAR